jgi:hypothetical protein
MVLNAEMILRASLFRTEAGQYHEAIREETIGLLMG